MKKILAFLTTLLITVSVFGQAPASFKYQAVLRDTRGNVKANTATSVIIQILQGSATGTSVFSETHNVTTDGYGMINLDLGTGTATLGTLSGINWGAGTYFVKVSVDGIAMGTSQLLSVPYALYSSKAGNGFSGNYNDLTNKPDLSTVSAKKLTVTGETTNMEEALFEVKNKSGQTVFAVYNEGVRIYVDDGSKGAKGGFAIGGFGTAKAPSQDYLVVKPDSIRMYVDDTPGKGAKGGFAIGGFGTAKSSSQKLLIVNPDSIRAYIDTSTGKGAKGGFAIGGFGQAKSAAEEYLRITRDSTRVYINDTPSKAPKGGFAIGGFTNAKGLTNEFLLISPDSTNFYVRSNGPDASSTFNILSIGDNQVQKSLMKANSDTIDMASVLNLQNNFNVFGNIGYTGSVSQIVIPDITTAEVINITQTSATSGGNINNNGGAAIIVSGICWSISSEPTIALATKTTDGAVTGSFAGSLTGLTAGTIYYVRAYATNSAGTAYGNQVSFTAAAIPVVPILTTNTIYDITSTSATSGGFSTNDGGAPITVRGICWSTNPIPTISDNINPAGIGTGSYLGVLAPLSPSTKYYVRAYATNSVGTGYGNELSFTTLPIAAATVNDFDGNVYNTVTIGTQTWFSENLKTTSYSDGTTIPLVLGGTAWSTLTTPGFCWYNNDAAANKSTYGGLYNWYAVNAITNGGKNVCPEGWHVPTQAEWITLSTYLGGDSVSGGKMKEVGTTHWNSPNIGATNESGFTVIPSGGIWTDGLFKYMGDDGYWWTSSEYTQFDGRDWLIYTTSTHAVADYEGKGNGLAVRCLQGDPQASLAVIFTMPASSITESGATSGGEVMSDRGAPVIVRGVCWNTTGSPTVANTLTSDGTGTGPFSSSIAGLTAATTYYVRAYATNSAGVAYGNEISFTTNSGAASLATLTTNVIVGLSFDFAASGGTISSDGGAQITDRGVVWGTSTNPTLADFKTSDGTGTGFYPSQMTALTPSTTYYVRAYATNSAGTAYGNELTFTTTSAGLAIGQSYQGGIIAYIFQPGDPGYLVGETHGLIAAPTDQSTGIQWYNGSFTTTGASGTAMGTGISNTNTIVTSQGIGTYAAQVCSDLYLGGYSDWYLPSKDELNKVYLNQVAIGGFIVFGYWTSTENLPGTAWHQDFGNGTQIPGFGKDAALRVRAVRMF